MNQIRETYANMTLSMENPFGSHRSKWIHIWIASFLIGYAALMAIAIQFGYMERLVGMTWTRYIHPIAILAAVYMAMNRDTFLPFLGESFLPEIFLKTTPKTGEKKDTDVVVVGLRPDSVVYYWAADPGKEVAKDWKQGYGRFENSGIVRTDKEGKVTIPVVCPARYIVQGYRVLPKHVHYRYYNPDTQMLSRIYTKNLPQCG